MLRHLVALSFVVSCSVGCAPSAVCGEGPACDESERCSSGHCVADAAMAVTVEAFAATPQMVGAGGMSTLSWTTKNAASCVLSPGFGSVPRTGSVDAYPEGDTTYTLSCEGEGGPVDAEATVRVVGGDAGAPMDGGSTVDGGPEVDGGSPADGGLEPDAGVGGDGGPPVVVSASVTLIPAPASIQSAAASLGPILFQEQEGMLLEGSEMCDSLYPGVWGAADEVLLSDEPRCQPKPGLLLDTWLLHLPASSPSTMVQGTLTFSRDIVAIDWSNSTLNEGDLAYQAPDTAYVTGTSREFELEADDSFVLAHDRRSVTFTSYGGDVDELRILVDASSSGQLLYTWTVDLEERTDVTLDARDDDDHLLLLDEGVTTLSEDLQVNATSSGKIEGDGDLQATTLSAGTSLRSWLLHFDPATVDSSARNVRGSITFPRRILAVIVDSGLLEASDARVGKSGVLYDSFTPSRGLELQGVDYLWWSEDGRSVRVQLGTPPNLNSLDQLRVLTEP